MTAAACTEDVPPQSADGHTIAYLLDGSPPDAELVTSPALAGLELAAREAGNIEIEPVNVGLDRGEVMAALGDLAEDGGVVAAIVAPWTAPPPGAIELLAADGVPVVTFSWAWGPPERGAGLWLSLVPERAREAVILLSAAVSVSEGAPLCLAGDDHATSRSLLATAEALGEAAGDPELVMAGIASSERAGTADAVAAHIRDARCTSLVWVGGASAAASVLSSIPGRSSVVGTSRIKTDDGLELASSDIGVHTVCACADVSLSTDPRSRRFVHDLQAESGAPPGPFAVEAYDAGRLLIGLLESDNDTREELAEALDDLTRFRGLLGAYAFDADGSRSPARSAVGVWRAVGSRWLPEPAPPGPSA
jgi:ABC-type branched-subunit amino acid transport system substrate-binding protein